MANEPTLTLLAHRDRWLVVAVDARTDTPRYFICDTDRLDDPDANRRKVSQFINDFDWGSSGAINKSNTVYIGFPMQPNLPDASYAVAYWMRERMHVRMQLERTRDIRDLFHDCFNEWRIVTVNREDLRMKLVRDLRVEIAQNDAKSAADREGQPTPR